MQRISVVLINMAPMLREIVREAVSAEAHIDVVRDFRDPIDLLTVVERHEPDVVITGMEANRDECIVEALHTSPRLRIIGLAQDGRTLYLHQFAWRRLEVRGISSECLLDAIRGTTEAKGASECQLH